MATDSNDKDNIHSDAHESLVKSLESIKDLLLQSESKISAAKASIARASMGPTKAQERENMEKNSLLQNKTEPTLDFDFSESDSEPSSQIGMTNELPTEPADEFELADDDVELLIEPRDDEVPLLDDIVVHGSKVTTKEEPTTPALAKDGSTSLNAETINFLLAEFQVSLEKKLHDVLIHGIVQLEAEVNDLLEEEINKLRNEISHGE